MGLNELRDEALRIAVEHGFKGASVGECIALMHSELSEALEEHRAGEAPNGLRYEHPDGSVTRIGSGPVARQTVPPPMGKPCGIPAEMADVIIRVLHFCGKHKIDVERAVREKMTYNESRPVKHGGKVL